MDPGERHAPRPRHRRPVTVLVTVLGTVLMIGSVAACSVSDPGPLVPDPGPSAEEAARTSAEVFFDRYVDTSGRVILHDQGGDTVSEGQAYALLLAVALRDRERFQRVWTWTKDNLQRDDGLFSWLWKNDRVADDQPATDADLDTARALLLAGQQFDAPQLTKQGERVGRGILKHETAVINGRRVLLPGPWADQAPPVMINVSYVSPAATQQLYEATGDRRWRDLEEGSRAMIATLNQAELPPDWAVLQSDGMLQPSRGGPSGAIGFGWDAVRTPIRHAESCVEEDRDFAGRMAAQLDSHEADVLTQPIGWVARAASYAAADRPDDAARALAKVTDLRKDVQTYYGDAWDALGRYLLLDDRLGGCPPDVGD